MRRAGRTLAFFSFCCALPLGFNATADRPGIAAIRVRQSFEFDSTFLDETLGTLPFVHSSAHESDLRAAEAVISAGADLVIGHHPHCLHPVEFYGERRLPGGAGRGRRACASPGSRRTRSGQPVHCGRW
ncbi:CapA family protein [Amycolatopsis sp. NBC_00345]|uniref:CapA family protein n=1 Tax=Amycolatopsis sp. NBC_00345 TaxID=2975955 RepID=UPI002E2698BA